MDDEIKESLKKRAAGLEEEEKVDGMVFGAIAE
jgi:hypothetical protein